MDSQSIETSGRRVNLREAATVEAVGRCVITRTRSVKVYIPKGSGMVKRTKITRFSPASRRRFRKVLGTYETIENCIEYAVTLTVPGPVLSREEKDCLWNVFQHKVKRAGWGCIWRCEVQLRGQVHWHCIVHVPERLNAGLGGIAGFNVAWFSALDTLGQCRHETDKGTQICSRSNLSGAWKRGIQVEERPDTRVARWEMYLLDHQSKDKEKQVVSEGRNWGVINKGLYRRAAGEEVKMWDSDLAKYLRLASKWSRRRVLNPGASRFSGNMWDYHLGKRPSRGRRGEAVWFGLPHEKLLQAVEALS